MVSKRIFERLRDEHGYMGGVTIVKGYVALCRQRSQEMFVPLEHSAGHAQVDVGGQSELFRDGGSGSFGLEFRWLSTARGCRHCQEGGIGKVSREGR